MRALFDDSLWEQRGTRLLADVTWTPRDAPTPHELRRAYAAARSDPDPEPLGAPETEALLALLAARETEPARGLEAFAACGVRWLIEHFLHPERIEPDPEPMQRGSLAHAVLERTLALLRERTGSARDRRPSGWTPRSRRSATRSTSASAAAARARRRALLRGLEADLERYLRTEAEHGAGFEPEALEWSFGRPEDPHGPLAARRGRRRGDRPRRPDRRGPGGAAIVRDYKGRTAVGGAKWEDDLQLQVPLYLLAVRELLGREPVAGLYQPLAGRKLAARGLVRDDVPGDYVRTDTVDAAGFDDALEAVRDAGRADRRRAARRADPAVSGALLEPRLPRTPRICRAGEPRNEPPA